MARPDKQVFVLQFSIGEGVLRPAETSVRPAMREIDRVGGLGSQARDVYGLEPAAIDSDVALGCLAERNDACAQQGGRLVDPLARGKVDEGSLGA